MIKKNFLFLLTAIFLCIVGVSFLYGQLQTSLESKGTKISSVSINEVEKQTVVYKEKQTEINKTSENINKTQLTLKQFNLDKMQLEKDLINLTAEDQNIQNQILENTNGYKSISAGKNLDKINPQAKENYETLDKLLNEKSKTNLAKQEEIKQKIEQKNTEIIASEATIKSLEQSLDSKKNELIIQLNSVINIGLLLASNYAIYILILAALWILYKFALSVMDSELHNENIRAASRKTIKIIWAITSVFVVFYAFAGQFSYILATFGFVSAALVFALQNFVASFFVFVIVSFTKIIKKGDIVKVGPTSEGYTGEVLSIGRFYTFIKEISPENQEILGRTVSIPNSFLLIHPITNFTVNNKVIWQSLKVIVDGESDQPAAKQILNEILTTKFDWVKDRQHQYLDREVNLTELTPKLSMSLEERGVGYTLHFPCHFQKYNEIYDQLLTEVLGKFKASDIKIAFLK
jgi:small-conductance mechanosensitive channel